MIDTPMTDPSSPGVAFEWITKGGALVLLAIVLAYIGRVLPRIVERMQTSFDSAIQALREEAKLERESNEKRAREERDACDARAAADRQMFASRFEGIERTMAAQTQTIAQLATAIAATNTRNHNGNGIT